MMAGEISAPAVEVQVVGVTQMVGWVHVSYLGDKTGFSTQEEVKGEFHVVIRSAAAESLLASRGIVSWLGQPNDTDRFHCDRLAHFVPIRQIEGRSHLV